MLLHGQTGYGSNTTIHLAARDPVEGTSDTAGSLAPGSRLPAGPGNRHTPCRVVVGPASRGGTAGAVASGAMRDRTTPRPDRGHRRRHQRGDPARPRCTTKQTSTPAGTAAVVRACISGGLLALSNDPWQMPPYAPCGC